MRRALTLCLALVALAAPVVAQAPAPKAQDSANTLILELKNGKVTIELRPDLAPKHVERIKQLAREKFYDGIIFHRVIAGFMAQTGDPTGTGSGGSKLPDLKAEFTPTPFERGTVGAARTNEPDTANSQFFICFTHTPSLNGQYTVWGRVTDGMNLVDQIAKGEPPPSPDKIVRMYVLADEPPAQGAAEAPPAKKKAPAAAAPAKDAKAPPAKDAKAPAKDAKAAPAKTAPAKDATPEVLPWAKK